MARISIKLSLGVAAALASLLVAVPALAYSPGPGSFGVAPATVAGGAAFTFSAHFVLASGAPFPAGVSVTFSEASGPAGCQATFSPVVTTTDSAGIASSTDVLPVGCAGVFVLLATSADPGSVSVTVTEVSAAAPAGAAPSQAQAGPGAFPNTTSLPPGTTGPSWLGSAIGFGGGATLLIVALALMVWRQRRSRREA